MNCRRPGNSGSNGQNTTKASCDDQLAPDERGVVRHGPVIGVLVVLVIHAPDAVDVHDFVAIENPVPARVNEPLGAGVRPPRPVVTEWSRPSSRWMRADAPACRLSLLLRGVVPEDEVGALRDLGCPSRCQSDRYVRDLFSYQRSRSIVRSSTVRTAHPAALIRSVLAACSALRKLVDTAGGRP